MKVEEAQKLPITMKEPQKFVQNQKKDKPEPGLTEEQVETLKQVSSLVAMFQQEALNEKETRLLAQLKAIEKDKLASDAWKIIAALKKEKGDLETQVERLKAQNSKLAGEKLGPVGGCKKSKVKPSESRQSEVKLPDKWSDNNKLQDELNTLLVKDTIDAAISTVTEKEKALNGEQTKNVPDATACALSNTSESTLITDMRIQEVTSKKIPCDKSPVTVEEFRDPVAGVCGLENLGNTCFVNAGLQCLFSVTPFCRFLLGGGHKTVTEKNPKNSQHLLSKTLGELVTKVWSGSYLQCDPTDLYTAITSQFSNQLTPQRQHDCHEFLALFLDGLHQELNCADFDSLSGNQYKKSSSAEQRWREYTRNNDSLIVDTFQGQLQSKITCSNCSHESFKYQPFTFLSVPLLSESYHTFVVTWVYRDIKETDDGKVQAVKYKLQVTKPSTVLKLKTNFVSLLYADDKQPCVKDLKVSVVRNSQLISIMSDDKQLSPFTDRRSKLYIFKPSNVPESLYVQGDNTKQTSLLCSAGRVSSQTNDSTMYYSPEAASASEFMSALDFQSESTAVDKTPLHKHHHNRLTSPNTSTPKTRASQRTRTSLSHVYRLSGTCSICLKEKTDNELIPHDKCGRLFCRQCLQDAAGGVIEYQMSCPRCAKQETVIHSNEIKHKSRAIIVPVLLRRFEEDSKTKRLFGHPNLIIVPTNILGKDIHSFIARLLPEPLCSRPFTLHLVDQQGLHCSRCTKITGCIGCQVSNDVTLNLQSCDNLAVQLTNITRWEAERMYRCTEHDSMWKTRKTEDLLQLQKCLKTFIESEELPGTWYCQKCREERNASKCFSMCRLPDTLIIHLKRYSQSGVKITAPVEFPLEELDMGEFTKLELGAAGEFVYDLIGCVCHEGSYSSGHYTAYTNNNGVWYRYDDSHVTKEKPSNICYAQAYILFYRRRAVSPLSTSTNDTQDTVFPRTLEDKHVPLSEEAESTTNENKPTTKLSQCSPEEKKKTLKEIGEELTQKLAMLQPAAHRVCRNNLVNNDLTPNQIKRRRWRTKQKMPGKLKGKKLAVNSATDKPNRPAVKSAATCEEGNVNTCGCKQCEYFKALERQIKKAKLLNDEQSRCKDALETAKILTTSARDSSNSVLKKSSSVSLSIHSSVSPSASESCTTVSSEYPGYFLPKDTAVQVTLCDHEKNQSPNTKQLYKKYSGGDSNLDDVGMLSQKLKSAIEDENIRRAVTLLRRGADPNVLVNGLGSLHTAVGLDSPLNLRFTRLLLDYGADPDIPSADGLTPIHIAAMWNRVNCLKLLIDRGGNPYQKDNEGMNALKLAKAFEADTSDFLEKLDHRISKQLQQASFQSVSLDSDSADDLSPRLQSPRVGCSFPVKGLGKDVSMKAVGRKVSRNLRRASGQFRRGIRQIRSLLSSSSSSDRQIKD